MTSIQPVENFKALSYRLFLPFGLLPMDAIIIIVLFFLVDVLLDSFYVDLIVLTAALYIAKKSARRPDSFFTSLAMFIITPPKTAINYYSDVTPYRTVLENKGIQHDQNSSDHH